MSKSIHMLFVGTFVENLLHNSTKSPNNSIDQSLFLKTIITLATLLSSLIILLKIVTTIIKSKSKPVFLIDFACYKPKDTQKVSTKYWLNHLGTHFPSFKEETLNLMEKMTSRSGLGPMTYLSTGILMQPPNLCMEEARNEAEEAVFGAVDRLLEKTGVAAHEVDILVVNCSVFNPVPSICSIVVNKYKMREDVKCYNLSGMGCGAGLVSIHLANNLLQVHKNSYALVVSTETITQNIYLGNDKSKLPPNCAFRVGATSILLSNRHLDRHVAKYRLVTAICTNTSRSDTSYFSVFQEEDSEGLRGITTSRHLIAEASSAIKENLVSLGPAILPVKEQFLRVINLVARKLHLGHAIKPYLPKFSHAVEHFITHVGGKPVIDSVERVLGFRADQMEASRMNLYRFGNTSSSSVWYGLGYEEAKGRVKKGNKAWQIGFGSGFTCASVVWKALRDVQACEKVNPWMSDIHEFPPSDFNLEGLSSTGPTLFELSSD